MSLDALFTHSLVVRRLVPAATVAGTPPGSLVDEWGHPAASSGGEPAVRGYADLATVRGLVQERTGTEIQGDGLAGTVVSNAVIFFPWGTDVTTQDLVAHGDAVYDVLYVRDPGGRGHHVEADARRRAPGLAVA